MSVRILGSWYLSPHHDNDTTISTTNNTEVYFKSTDGHVGTYAISLKRLNIQLLELLHKHDGCYLVDSSVRKTLPDSFSRTIPIWCCVMNRIVVKYRDELGMNDGNIDDWDTQLYTPSSIISPEEHTEISNLIDSRVMLLYHSKAIVDPNRLVKIMTKPVRAYWVSNDSVQHDTNQFISHDPEKFFTIICCNPSFYIEGSKNHIEWIYCGNNDDKNSTSSIGYYYTPGAADDDTTWGRNLTPQLFYANRAKLLDPSLTEDETDNMIDCIVNEWKLNNDTGMNDYNSTTCNKIGEMNLWIGSRRSGHPNCWDNFDAILNVTENEYPNMIQSIKDQQQLHGKTCYYLQLPIEEGKKDKYQLERWLPVGLAFIIHHLQYNRRVLVHCAQGSDRSVAVVLALVTLTCEHTYPLRLISHFESINIQNIFDLVDDQNDYLYLQSGLAQSLVNVLLQENGKDLFLKWMHEQLNTPVNKPFANKDSLRIVLHLVRQDRENAEPTRSTMQKLNRFFMSSKIYRITNNK